MVMVKNDTLKIIAKLKNYKMMMYMLLEWIRAVNSMDE